MIVCLSHCTSTIAQRRLELVGLGRSRNGYYHYLRLELVGLGRSRNGYYHYLRLELGGRGGEEGRECGDLGRARGEGEGEGEGEG